MMAVALTAVYAYYAPPSTVLSPQLAAALELPGFLYLAILMGAIVAFLADLLAYSERKAATLEEEGVVPLTPSSIGPYILHRRKYWAVFVGSAVAYGVLYSLLTGVVVYWPDVSFRVFPGLAIPSVQADQLAGVPLYVPEVTVFLSEHVALVIIPLTLILMVAISVLVGFNSALAAYSYDNRARGGGSGSWAGQLGAAVGLFTGCPTCAGLYFFSLLGGSGAASVAVALGLYQPLFVALSLPVLLVTPYLICRSLSRLFRDGCVVAPPGVHQRS